MLCDEVGKIPVARDFLSHENLYRIRYPLLAHLILFVRLIVPTGNIVQKRLVRSAHPTRNGWYIEKLGDLTITDHLRFDESQIL